MASASADAAGCCGLCVYSALGAWCILHPFGADVRCCSGPRGCCGSCCDNPFNEDDFDERLKKVQAKNGPGTGTEPVDSQPTPSQGMSTAAGDSKPTNDPEEVQL